MKTVYELNVFLSGFMFCLKTFFLSHTAYYMHLLKCFTYSKVMVSYILHGAQIHVAPTINLSKVSEFKLFTTYPQKNISQEKSCLPNSQLPAYSLMKQSHLYYL